VAVAGALIVGLSYEDALPSYVITNTAIGISAAPCGLLIARARPGNPIGWLFLGLALAPLVTAAAWPLLVHGALAGWPEGVLRLLVTMFLFSWPWGVLVCLPIALQLFPTGQPVSPRWRWLLWATVGVGIVGSYGTGPTPELGASSYLVLPGHAPVESLLWTTVFVWPRSVASLVVRYARGDEVTRRQLLWVVLAVLIMVAVSMPWAFSVHSGGEILFLLAFPLIPIAVTIAVLRHRLFDVGLVVSRVLLYELLTVGVVLAYLGLVAVLDSLLRGAGAPVLATLAVALAVNPARTRLQRGVDRLLYGAARDPVRAVSQVGQRLAGEDLVGVLDGLRDALRLPYAAVEVDDQLVATSGEPTTSVHVTPLQYRGEGHRAADCRTAMG
jgi:hypothetical protein